ncbi:MAG: hypothetical protein ACLR5T_00565 [Veillonella sp.]
MKPKFIANSALLWLKLMAWPQEGRCGGYDHRRSEYGCRRHVTNRFGDASSTVESKNSWEVKKRACLCRWQDCVPMIASQDHKRIFDGDKGPNTGGMGTYAPAPVLTNALRDEAMKTILEPMVAAMEKEGMPYVGCLYAGLMITSQGPKVVEFNARFGDPETQVVLPLLDSDLGQIMMACATGH